MFRAISKDCNKECRFTTGMSMTTAMYFPPVYDKNGENLNPDGNITSQSVMCNTCKKKWTASTQFGETTYNEV
jgi:hypothetical protein